jgi:hypothetical protein
MHVTGNNKYHTSWSLPCLVSFSFKILTGRISFINSKPEMTLSLSPESSMKGDDKHSWSAQNLDPFLEVF